MKESNPSNPIIEITLEDRLKASIGKTSAPSLIPTKLEPKKESEKLPEMQEVITDQKARRKLVPLLDMIAVCNSQKRDIDRELKPYVSEAKGILGEYGTAKFMCGMSRVAYYPTPRTSISAKKLLEHGVSPAIVTACSETKLSWNLRVTPPGEGNGYDEGGSEG